MRTTGQRSGFTLVEIALAIMVISMGMLAVFSLFPAGMASNKYAIDDTYAALFAEEVFYGYRAQASVNPWGNIENLTIPSRSPEKWLFTDQLEVRPNRGMQTVRYIPADPTLEGDLEDFALRYELVVRRAPADPDNRAYATLEVWPGAAGPTDNPLRFYTEFFNTGD